MAISRWCGRCLTTHTGDCPKAVERQQRWKHLKKQWAQQHGRARRRTPAAAAMRRKLKADGGRCAKCGSTRRLEVDHRLALRDGGEDVADNLQILCHDCHAKKSHAEWVAGRHERMRQASGIMQFARRRPGG